MRRRTWIALGAVALLAAVAGLNTWVYGDFKAPIFEPLEPLPGVDSLSAATCSACHSEIYAEWKRSGHARAFTDPLYQAELQHQPAPFVCHRCHTPLVEQREELGVWFWTVLPELVPYTTTNERFDPELRDEGVTCVVCHQVDDAMVGPFDDAQGAPHPTRKGALRAVETCATCHQFGFDRIGKLHRPIIDTVTEWHAFRDAGNGERCADCHMPVVPPRPAGQIGPTPGVLRIGTDHSLRGPFDPEFVATGVVVENLTLAVASDSADATLSIFNGTGHRLPTAEPERFVEVRLAALDGAGGELAVATTRFERPVNVVKLRELGPDTTLAVAERRPVELSLPQLPSGTATVRVSVDFWLWNPAHESARAAGMSAEDLMHRIAEKVEVVSRDG
ncbi:MAG: multiheme c-type cytochrome [Myxococcota bacterium]